jgi:hypothetical protein
MAKKKPRRRFSREAERRKEEITKPNEPTLDGRPRPPLMYFTTRDTPFLSL